MSNDNPAQAFSLIAQERTSGLPENKIKNLYITDERTGAGEENLVQISTAQLFSRAKISLPEALGRALETSFMAGLAGEQENRAVPFLILKVSGHDSGLAGMLAWESALPRFFDSFFGMALEPTNDPRGAQKFRDAIVANRDVRILERAGGAIVYAFANETTVVIAGSRHALELLLPLAQNITGSNVSSSVHSVARVPLR